MIMGTRILERMKLKELSQAELARRVGMKQPSIFNLIHRGKKGSTKLHLIARELETTAAYLSGETDDPTAEAAAPPSYDSETRELIDRFAHLGAADRRAILQIARSMAGGEPPSETVHQPAGGYKGEGADRA